MRINKVEPLIHLDSSRPKYNCHMKAVHKSLIVLCIALLTLNMVESKCKRRRKHKHNNHHGHGNASANGSGCGPRLDLSQEAFQHLNEYRASRGLGRLSWDGHTYNLCQEHNQYQASRGSISHDNFNGRLKRLGRTGNENVAYNFEKHRAGWKLFDQWRNSHGHNKNMLAINMNAGAVAVYHDCGKGRFYGTNINIRR